MSPKPLSEAPIEEMGMVRALCFDIDETFTSHSRIGLHAWRALWMGYEAGLSMIPVTGRPAGWCDMICRFWPVQGVVGENGAFYFSYDSKERQVVRCFARSEEQRIEDRKRLEIVSQKVLKAVPEAQIASDQAYRIADLAVDFAEDVGPLSQAKVRCIVDIMEEEGLNAKVSSIHVNGWCGDYDKRSMLIRFVSEQMNMREEEALERIAYVGDSPNDAPLFAAFPLSIGVSNVERFLSDMDYPPKYITREAEGDGFAELVEAIVNARQAKR